MSVIVQVVILGIVLGAVYGLVALGFTLIYKSTGILNLAQGELVLFGAYLCFAFSTQMGLPFYLSVVLTLCFSFALGFAIERILLRPMIGQPLLSIIMMTIGLAYLLRGIIVSVWGVFPLHYSLGVSLESVDLFGFTMSPIYFYGAGIAALMIIGFSVFYKFSRQGVTMRAVSENQTAAQSLGIRVKRVFGTAWALSCLTAAVGGIIWGILICVYYPLSDIGLRVFPAVLVGGLESIPGAIVGGLIIGLVESFAGAYIDPVLMGFKDIAPYVVLLIVMLIRPHGLFGLKRIERL